MNNREYVVAFKVQVQQDGSVLIIAGNTRLVLSAYQVRALIDGTLRVGSTLASLHREIDTVVLEILAKGV